MEAPSDVAVSTWRSWMFRRGGRLSQVPAVPYPRAQERQETQRIKSDEQEDDFPSRIKKPEKKQENNQDNIEDSPTVKRVSIPPPPPCDSS